MVWVVALMVFSSGPQNVVASSDHVQAIAPQDRAKYRAWIQGMKKSAKGPFIKIRWFCKDGSILPPKAYACSKLGGGIQHGLWNDRILSLHKAGFQVGNVLAELQPDQYTGADADLDGLKQVLLERFLMAADDGWIFRGARSYRGAFQAEDEEAASERLLLAMLNDPLWLGVPRFALLREVVRLLPQKNRSPAAAEVRQLSVKIHKEDRNFATLRAIIHATPSREDASRVRHYASSKGKKKLQKEYQRLAKVIDQVFDGQNLRNTLKLAVARLKNKTFKQSLKRDFNALQKQSNPEKRLRLASQLMVQLRETLTTTNSTKARLALLRASLSLEQEVFQMGTNLMKQLGKSSRRRQLQWLSSVAKAMYGAGFLYERHLSSIEASLKRLFALNAPSVKEYQRTVRYLVRAIGWSDRTWAFHFKESQNHLFVLEPLVDLYPQDRLRGSPLLFYGMLMDSLVMDANRLANMEHRLFGQVVGAGIRALNPGLARGVLHISNSDKPINDSQGIYLLPETTSDLTPVAGILTRGEGNALSHVQLLARNLAIPNAVIGDQWLPEINRHVGSQIVMSISEDGVVTLEADSAKWDRFFQEKKNSDPGESMIRPDLEKLNLESHDFISLTQLRAADSGRLAGPKGANLGELKHLFGDAIPSGFVIPFGVFRAFLEQPYEVGGPSVFEWMKQTYVEIAKLPQGSDVRQNYAGDFLAKLRYWIENSNPGAEYKAKLRHALQEHFGKDGDFGVFVRSDTNVEDLPGFTGAGLNRTIANVVGYDNIVKAVQQVWASPFTERAYAWRQSHMEQPYNVFPAVLIQYSFPSQKSGVMVTKDVVWGEPGWISVAVNEGVGGAVDGQAAESLRINIKNGETRLLAHATAPYRRELTVSSGLQRVAASGSDRVLEKAEIKQLIQLAKTIPEKFPSLRDEHQNPMPADVEFAFREGRMALLQIRPFVEAKGARRLGFVANSATGNQETRESVQVQLDAIPEALLP